MPHAQASMLVRSSFYLNSMGNVSPLRVALPISQTPQPIEIVEVAWARELGQFRGQSMGNLPLPKLTAWTILSKHQLGGLLNCYFCWLFWYADIAAVVIPATEFTPRAITCGFAEWVMVPLARVTILYVRALAAYGILRSFWYVNIATHKVLTYRCNTCTSCGAWSSTTSHRSRGIVSRCVSLEHFPTQQTNLIGSLIVWIPQRSN